MEIQAQPKARSAKELLIGTELGYSERDSNDSTTNTVIGNAPVNKISGLILELVGTGRPVELEFFCPAVVSTTAGKYVGAAILVNGTQVKIGQQSSPATSSGRSLLVKTRMILEEGVEYTVEVGKYGETGTSTYGAAATYTMYLSAVAR